MLKDFRKFILRGNTVDLAVAVVVGAAFNGIVTSLVKDIVTPLITTVGGKPTNLDGLYFTIRHTKFPYGDFLNAVVSFLIIATVVFFMVVQPINKLIALANGARDTEEPTTKKCPECLSEIPKDARRCLFCTTRLKAN